MQSLNFTHQKELSKPSFEGATLFLTCPCCQLEAFLEAGFGKAYFYSVLPGHQLISNEREFKALLAMILRENITDIILVNESSCRRQKAVQLAREYSISDFAQQRNKSWKAFQMMFSPYSHLQFHTIISHQHKNKIHIL